MRSGARALEGWQREDIWARRAGVLISEPRRTLIALKKMLNPPNGRVRSVHPLLESGDDELGERHPGKGRGGRDPGPR